MATKVNTDKKTITKAEIAEVVSLHMGLVRMTLVKSLILGEKLVSMKDRVASRKWGKWIKENLPQISWNSVNRYMRLFNEKAFIEKKFKVKLVNLEKLQNYPEGWPTSVEVDHALRERDRNPARGDSAAGGIKAKGTGSATNEGTAKGNGSGKDTKSDLRVAEKYTLATFGKELGVVIKRAREEGIPIKAINAVLQAAQDGLVKMSKATEVKVKPA